MAKGSTHNMSRLDTSTKDKLARAIKRIESLKDQQAELGDEIKDVKKDLKDIGFDMKAVNRILSDNAARRRDAQRYEDFTNALDVYKVALGYED